VKQVIATSGTALTMEHLRSLTKLTKNIKLAFDADRAGLAATERAIEMGQKLGLTLRMVELPEGIKDADELIQQDVEAWKKAIGEAKYIVDYLFDRFEKDFDLKTAIGKRGYTDRLAANLRRLGDPVEQDHYVKLLAEKTGTSEEAVKAKIEKGEASKGSVATEDRSSEPVRRAVVQAQGRPSARAQQEEQFLGINLLYDSVRASLEDLSAERFSSDERKVVFEALREGKPDSSSYAEQLKFIAEEEFSELDDIALRQRAFELARLIFLESNKDLKDRLIADIRAAEVEGDAPRQSKLMREFQSILESEA
jgi:DNA primase